MHVYEHCDNPGEDYIGNFCKVNVIARYPDHYNTTLNFYNFTENGLIPELKKKKKKDIIKEARINTPLELESGAKKNFGSKVDRKHEHSLFSLHRPICQT